MGAARVGAAARPCVELWHTGQGLTCPLTLQSAASTHAPAGNETLGTGASGSVYRGDYRDMPVAVKFAHISSVDGELQSAALETLQLETRILSRVCHPNIVRL